MCAPLAARSAPRFCLETATLLAGFAFESYVQPDVDWQLSPDGVRTALLSPAFVKEYYDGFVAVDAVKASLFRPEGLLPLQPLDTYIELQVTGGEPVKTGLARATESPEWLSDEPPRYLYVRGVDEASLVISVYFQNMLQGGKTTLLGRAQVPLRELAGGKEMQLWGQKYSLSSGAGQLELKASFVSFDDVAAAEPSVEGLLGQVASGNAVRALHTVAPLHPGPQTQTPTTVAPSS